MDLACLQADQLLRQFENLVHYTLVRAGVGQKEAHYEDLAQELRCQLLLLAKGFPGDPLGADRYRFTALAKQALYHKLIDLLRQAPRGEVLTADFFLYDGGRQVTCGWRFFLKAAARRLSAADYTFLCQVIACESWVALARDLGISTQALYERRLRLRQQLADLKTWLNH